MAGILLPEESMTETKPQEVVEKEVTLVAYSLNNDTQLSEREWSAKVTGVDTASYETRTRKNHTLIIERDDSYRFTKDISTNLYNELIEEAKENLEDDMVSIETEVDTFKSHNNMKNRGAWDFRDYLMTLLPDEISGGLVRDGKMYSTEENGDWFVKVNASMDTMRVLSKEEKRESDDLYETMAERPCLNFTIKMRSPNRTRIDQWTEEIITEMVKILSKHPHIGKVRFMDCVTTKTEEGECYNI